MVARQMECATWRAHSLGFEGNRRLGRRDLSLTKKYSTSHCCDCSLRPSEHTQFRPCGTRAFRRLRHEPPFQSREPGWLALRLERHKTKTNDHRANTGRQSIS